MTLSNRDNRKIVTRLHHIKGQLEGVERMIDAERPVKDIYVQLKAVEHSLHQAIYGLFDGQLKTHVAEVLAERWAVCPGDCDDAERLQFLKHEFSKLALKELLDELAWLRNSLSAAKSLPQNQRR
jgi:DNA-binding FrmR family transcriptional regulator